MKQELYFPHSAIANHHDELGIMREELGMEAYGIYWYLIEQLRLHADYKCRIKSLVKYIRDMKIKKEIVDKIFNDYNLFVVEDEKFYSVDLHEWMEPLEKHRMQKVEAAYASAVVRKKNKKEVKTSAENKKKDGKLCTVKCAAHASKEKKVEKEEEVKKVSREITSFDFVFGSKQDSEEEKVADEIKSLPQQHSQLQPYLGWEEYFSQMCDCREWLDIIGMKSGLGQLYLNNIDFILDSFRQHVITYSKESSCSDLNETKYYFASYMSPGCKTHALLKQKLQEREKLRRETDPYRFETRDPKTGKRTFCGMEIPNNAPPRPDKNAIWDAKKGQWRR